MMRRSAMELPGWIFCQYCLDRTLYLLAACRGDAGVINVELSVYRLHGGGVSGPLTPLEQAQCSVRLFSDFCRSFPQLCSRVIRISLIHILWSDLAAAMHQGLRGEAVQIPWLGVATASAMRLFSRPRNMPVRSAAQRCRADAAMK